MSEQQTTPEMEPQDAQPATNAPAESEKPQKKKKTLRQKVSLGLILFGALLLLAFGVYEGVSYPWKTLTADLGKEPPETLADPAPLPDSVTLIPLDDQPDYEEKEGAQAELPDQPNFFAIRKPMEITQLGNIKIPKIQLSENLVEGSGDELLYGVGHARLTAMPGQAGNCVLAGHRNYVVMRPFRYLDKVEVGDMVYVSHENNTYTYEVFKTFEIEPTDTWVMQPQDEEEYLLTLITCTPVLTYTHRLVIWGRLIDTVPLA